MRIVIQRVKSSSVLVNGLNTGSIDQGLLVLHGIEAEDDQSDIDYLVKKLNGLRIFNDEDGKMNDSIQDIQGSFLVVSQFTLYANTKKGNRPSYIKSADPAIAVTLYENFLSSLKQVSALKVAAGIFGADMKVSIINDGPVTIIMDSKDRNL